MRTVTKNPDGSITVTEAITQDIPQLDGTTKAGTTYRVWDIAAHQIAAMAADVDLYNALPADVRAEVDAQRAELAKAQA